ncbi:MAG TPA: BNR-4 repeat-containing protein [Candidatus Hydrogenedentes bacterium]|nr:BNR-4 repeat-containing protein [Candidatus Hydrogenedentota bacterium]
MNNPCLFRWIAGACLVALFAASPGAEEWPVSKDTGYRGIWYYNQKTNDEYVYKYSGGLGTYCVDHNPFCVYAAEVNKTFFVYGGAKPDRNTLVHMVSYYDHATGTVPRPTILLDKQTEDAHDNPVIAMDKDGYLWVFSSSHGTSRPSYISRGVAPYNIDRFERILETNFSYPQPWVLPDGGFLFLHTWYQGGRGLYWMTSPDGRAWSERRVLAHIAQGHYQISWPCGHRVGTAFNYHPQDLGLNFRTNVYYVETVDMGKTWTTVDGRVLDTPLTTVDNPALVHDYESEGLKVYMCDVNYDAEQHPILLYLVSKGWEPGPENGPRTWHTAHWTGAAWAIHRLTDSDNNYDMGSLYVEPGGLWRVIAPTETGPQPYNPGGEVAMWTSSDAGATWTKARQLTANSEYNHTYVRRPVNAHPGFYAFWADGHGRRPSESRLYFYSLESDTVYRLPFSITGETAEPEAVYTEVR